MRVAVCLSGHSRAYKEIDPRINTSFFPEGSTIDYFISTYKQNGMTPTDQEFKLVTEQFGVFGRQETKEVNINDIFNYFNPKGIEITDDSKVEDFIEKKFSGSYHKDMVLSQVASMFYKIYRANLLKKNYEEISGFKYDFVIRQRFENKLLDINIGGRNDKLYIKKHKFHPRGVHDLLFMGSSEIMDWASNCFLWLMEKNLDYFYNRDFPEYMLQDYLVETSPNKNMIWCEDYRFRFYTLKYGDVEI